MENVVKNNEGHEMNKNGGAAELLTESRESSCSKSNCQISTLEVNAKVFSSSSPLGWPLRKAAELPKRNIFKDTEEDENSHLVESKFQQPNGAKTSEVDMMKERFAKLLLGEDMSGSGKGVCSALAISNAITNLCATVFGQLWRLEPLPTEKKSIWQQEMECLLSVSDHIIELKPSFHTFADGSKMEVMTCRPRSDLSINLPALSKLDTILLETLDSFANKEFWYVEQGIIAPDTDGSNSFRKTIHRQEEQWWLPVPRVPPEGLTENTRRQLLHSRECTSQILKAAMAINSNAIAEMDIPKSYLESLPKNGRACLGDVIYRYVTSDKCSPKTLLDCLDLSSEHSALDIANRLEASIYVWRQKKHIKPPTHPNGPTSKSSWEVVKGLMVVEGDKTEILAERAEKILICLKQRFPNLTQTTLDATKIQFNKDTGKSILESYSRVLESLAYNIVARIDDLLYVDDLTRNSDKMSSFSEINLVARRRNSFPYSPSPSSTPYKKTASNATSYSPLPLISPARSERALILKKNDKPHRRGFGAKRVLANYLGVDTKSNARKSLMEARSCSTLNTKDNKNLGHCKNEQSLQRESNNGKAPLKIESFQDENQNCNIQCNSRRIE